MEGEHQYEIGLKLNDLYINLASDDVYFISKQMDKWFGILLDDTYVPASLPPAPAPVAAPKQEAPPVQEPVEEAPVQPEPVLAAPPVAETHRDIDLPTRPQAVPPTPPPPKPISPLITPKPEPDPVVMVPESTPVAEPAGVSVAPAPVLDEAVQDDFEAVMDSLMKDLDEEVGEAELESSALEAELVSEASENGKFGPIDMSLIESLADLCERSRAGTSEDYLLLAAFYLTTFENQDKFSLKRVNSMLVKSGLTPVNHSVLETTLSRGYLSMVPDLTGMAESSEYTLTEDGQSFVSHLL